MARAAGTHGAAVACLLLWGIAAAAPAAAGGGPVPRFAWTRLAHDTLVEGDTAVLSFPFVNTNAETLVVADVDAPCGCAVSSDAGLRVAPGDSGAITIEFRSAGQRDGGARTLSVLFRAASQAAQTPPAAATLSFSVPVRSEVRFAPAVLSGRRGRRDATVLLAGEVLNTGQKPVQVVGLSAEAPGLQVLTRQLPLRLERGERLSFVVSAGPGSLPDNGSELLSAVRLRTTGTRYPLHRCDIHIFPGERP